MERLSSSCVLDLRPSAQSVRSSEGDFIRLADGSLLFVYTRFFDQLSDEGPSSLAAVRSDDEGRSWSAPREVVSAARYGAKNVMSVSLLPLQSGEIGLFFIAKGDWYTRILLARSSDGGQSFGRETECTLSDRRGWFVLNNSRVVRLKSGRLLLPLAHHRTGLDGAGKLFFDPCASACFLYSDDDGAHWTQAPDIVRAPFSHTQSGLQEPGAVELKSGALWAYFRTDQMVQYESFSLDGGLHWTAAQPSRFSSPLSPMTIVRRPQTGALYAFFNPIPNYLGRETTCEGVWLGGRTPFVCAVSRDDGSTWAQPRVIADDPRRGYCYPAPFFTRDGALLLALCTGGVADGSCLARLSILRIPLNEDD